MFFGWRWKQDALPYSVIDRGTEVQGPIRSRGVLEVRGHVRGAVIHEGRMVVAPGGVCSGPVRSDDLYLQGEIHGDVTVTGTLRIGNGGQLYGDADCRRLIIDPGGCFVGINRSELEGRAAGPTATPAGGGAVGCSGVQRRGALPPTGLGVRSRGRRAARPGGHCRDHGPADGAARPGAADHRLPRVHAHEAPVGAGGV